jgi:hypothetical protein
MCCVILKSKKSELHLSWKVGINVRKYDQETIAEFKAFRLIEEKLDFIDGEFTTAAV